MNPKLRTRLLVVAIAAAVTAGCAQDDPGQLLQDANAAFAKGEFRTAEIHLKNLLQEQSENVDARLLLAKTYAAGRNWPLAEKEFRRALELGASVDAVGPGLLEAMFESRDFEGVIEQASKLEPKQPEAQAEVAVWAGRAWLQQGDAERARQAFQQALAARPSLAKAKVGLLTVQAGEGDEARARALESLNAILADAPDSHEALMLQAQLRFASGDLDGARVPLETVVAATPSDLVARSTLVAIDLQRKDGEAAKTHLDELLRRAPGWPVGLTQKAQLELLNGKRESARDTALEALKGAPEYLPALAIAGSTSLELGALEQAEHYARQMMRVAPQSATGHRLLASTFLKRGEPGAALRVVEPLLQLSPDDPQLLVMAGEAALRSGDAAGSEKYFARAASLDRNDPRKRVGLALARFETGDRAGAMAELELATEMDGGSQADQILIATLIAERRFDEALAAIAELEKKKPAVGEVALLRGRVALAKGDDVQARSQFEQALLEDPTLLPAVAILATMDVKDGKPDVARKRFEALVEKKPGDIRALLGLAKLTADTGGLPSEVRALLARAHDADPNSEIAALAYAQSLVAEGKTADAIQLLDSNIRNHPDWTRAQEALASVHIRAGEKEKARTLVDRIARARPDDAGTQFRTGALYNNLGDFAAALERFQRAQALKPDAAEPRVNIALAQARMGRMDDAHATAQALQKDHPRNPVGWALEGELLRSAQKWREAAAAFGKAAALEPALGANAFRQHDSLLRAGATAEADKLLQGWLASPENEANLSLYLGERALGRQDYAEAARRYETAVKADPRNVIARNNYAWALHQLKDPRALEVAEEAYRRAPNAAAVVDTLAGILEDGKQTQRALEMRRRAAALAPTSADLRLRYAQALKASNDRDAARREFEAISRDFPGTPQAETATRASAEL